MFAASAFAIVFSIPLISVRLLLTASYLIFAVFQGRVSCTGAKGASDEGFIVAAVAAGRVFAFQLLVLVDLGPRCPALEFPGELLEFDLDRRGLLDRISRSGGGKVQRLGGEGM